MLSSLYGVWAARLGNGRLSLEMLERGYGDFCTGRFMQTLEYRKDIFPEQPPAAVIYNWKVFVSGADYARLQAFITANPSWPNVVPYTFNNASLPYLNTPRTFRAVTTPQNTNSDAV